MGSVDTDKPETVPATLLLERDQLTAIRKMAAAADRSTSAQVRVLLDRALSEKAGASA